MDKFCSKHPKQKLIQLFSSYACDECDCKVEQKSVTSSEVSTINWTIDIDAVTMEKYRKQFKEALEALGTDITFMIKI